MASHAPDHQVLSFDDREALAFERVPGELAGFGEQALYSLLAGRVFPIREAWDLSAYRDYRDRMSALLNLGN